MSARSFTLDKKRQGNITVLNSVGSTSVLLHGHEVVKIEADKIVLNSCGYNTNTTKTAINRALSLLNRNERINQKNFQWFINGEKFNGIYTINN
jgi:hypothetical protein